MNRNKISLIVKTIALLAIAFVSVSPTFGQAFGRGGMGMGGDMGGMSMGMSMTPLEELKAHLRTSKGGAAQKRVLGKIKDLLSDQYDSFLQQNETELQEMEKSVKVLRAQLERRKSAKIQLLKLELQRISNEASGLVWPDEPSGMGMSGMGGMMGGAEMGGGSNGGLISGIAGNVMGDSGSDMVDSLFGSGNQPANGNQPENDTKSQLMQIALACFNFVSTHERFPKNICDEEGKPLLSWRVAILQYMDEPEQALYKKFKLDEPWNSANNIQLLTELPDIYKSSDFFNSNYKTVYQGFDGEGAMFESDKEIGYGQIIDGTSNTLLVAQMNRQSAVEWTKPADIKFKPGTPVTQLAETVNGSVMTVRCDGSFTEIKLEDLNSDTLEDFIRRDDGKGEVFFGIKDIPSGTLPTASDK